MSAPKFPVDEAQLVALFMESIAYGVYLVTLGVCVRVLFSGRVGTHTRGAINWPMVAVVVLMAVFATLDVALGLRHNLAAFILYSGPGGPSEEFDNISDWVNVMKTVDTQVMALIGDGMLIYRCHVVFAHSWLIIIFPMILWLASLACSVMIIYITATLRQDTTISQQSWLKPFLYSFFIITIILNLIVTGLIVWRIRGVNKRSSPVATRAHGRGGQALPRTRLQQVIRIIIESGLIYTTLVVATFICELAKSNAIYGVSDVLVVAIGISFNLIIIRVDQSSDTSVPASSSQMESAGRSYSLRFMRTSASQTASQPLQVVISRDVASDRELDEPDRASDKHASASKDRWGTESI